VISAFKSLFNFSSFENKLRHYFNDTSPIYADVEVGLNSVTVVCKSLTRADDRVTVTLEEDLGIIGNIAKIIIACEQRLYPRMLEFVERGTHGAYLGADALSLLTQGYSLEQVLEKQNIYKNYFIITRFNNRKSIVDFREDITGKLFRAYLKRPLITIRDHIIQLSEKGMYGMNELFVFITENSRLEQFDRGRDELSANFN